MCELSVKPMRRAQDELERRGLITVIRRRRANYAEATPVVLLNHPEAPHLNGKAVVLDFEGKFLYPLDPDGLRKAGVEWISANTLGRVHPKDEPERGGSERPGGGGLSDQGGVVGETTHGVVGETTLNQLPEEHPQHQRPSAGASGGGDGLEEKNGADAPGAEEKARELLANIRRDRVPGLRPHTALVQAVVHQLNGGHEPDVITRALLHDVDSRRKPAAGVTENARDLTRLIAEIGRENASQGQESASAPEWCGECEENGRAVYDPVTDDLDDCPRCHPKRARTHG